jgi:Na+/phosphate symporter
MNDLKVYHWTGAFGLAGVVLLLCEIPLWILQGTAPPINDAVAHSQYLADIRVVVLTRVLLDMGMYVSLMVFFAGFRHLIKRTRSEYEWVATLVFGAGLVWWAVTLVADSLEGAAALDSLVGTADPSAVKALVMGTLLIYNSSIAFTVTALFMASAGYAILATGALPRWTGWVACTSAILCLAAIPAMYVDVIDTNGFYNVVGWGPAIVANVPVLIWFLIASISMIVKRESVAPK